MTYPKLYKQSRTDQQCMGIWVEEPYINKPCQHIKIKKNDAYANDSGLSNKSYSTTTLLHRILQPETWTTYKNKND